MIRAFLVPVLVPVRVARDHLRHVHRCAAASRHRHHRRNVISHRWIDRLVPFQPILSVQGGPTDVLQKGARVRKYTLRAQTIRVLWAVLFHARVLEQCSRTER